MKMSTRDLLIAMSLIHSSEYESGHIHDEKVLECIMDMYFYMLYGGIGNEQKKEDYFNEFEKKYKLLNKEQQDEVKNDYISIIESQEKNKNKEKVKKKGMIDYE